MYSTRHTIGGGPESILRNSQAVILYTAFTSLRRKGFRHRPLYDIIVSLAQCGIGAGKAAQIKAFSEMTTYFLAIRTTMAARHVEWCLAR